MNTEPMHDSGVRTTAMAEQEGRMKSSVSGAKKKKRGIIKKALKNASLRAKIKKGVGIGMGADMEKQMGAMMGKNKMPMHTTMHK